MHSGSAKRSQGRAVLGPGAGALVLIAALALAASPARAAAPQVEAIWATEVAAKSARLHADLGLDPALSTSYQFNYIAEAAYEANLSAGKDGFAGAKTQPPLAVNVGAGTSGTRVMQRLANISPETVYRYRMVAKNSAGTAPSPVNSFTTQKVGGGSLLLDGRGWEMVSPVDKNGGQVDAPGANAGGGVLQVAGDGSSATFSSAASLGEDGGGAPPASQYLSRRGAGGWSTENITVPLFSGSYGTAPEGVPYRTFSTDLTRGLLLNGRRCRSTEEGCAVANPPLAGSGAPVGYQNYYLRDGGGFTALVDSTDVLATTLTAAEFEVTLAGASADLSRIVLSSCAALTDNATEVPLGAGCDPGFQNLYLYSAGSLTLLNVLPAQSAGTPGARLAAQSGAISGDGSRVYWQSADSGDLYLRSGSQTRQVDAAAAGGGSFEAASADGSVAFFSKDGHLYRYAAATDSAVDLTPAGGVQGVLGASADGGYLYYVSSTGLFLRRGATTTEVAASADALNYPPATGAARVAAGGARLAFLASESLTGYDNTGPAGDPVSQVFLYDAIGDTLTCASCNPTNARPLGPSTIPAATRNGEGPRATHAYKPRALSADGRRLFFDSADALVGEDTNNSPDVYEWEAQGTGSCAEAGGCLGLISSGRAAGGAFFVDASSDGADAFFRTDGSLVPGDPGQFDLYDARVGGGFPVPTPPLPCAGDACQSLPSAPVDPSLNTLVEGAGNPAVRFYDTNRHRPRYHRLRNHRHRPKGKKQKQKKREQQRAARKRGQRR